MQVPSFSPATVAWALIFCGCCANVLSLEFITKQFDFRTFRLTPRVIPLSVYFRLTVLFFVASVLNNMALNFNISVPVHTVFRSSGLAGTLLTGFIFYKKRYSVYQIVSCMLVCVGICVLTLADANVRKLQGCCDTPVMPPLQSTTLEPNSTSATTPEVAALVSNSTAAAVAAATGGLSSLVPASLLSSFPLLRSLLDGSALSLLEASAGGWDMRWIMGISMLTITLFLLAFLGHEQERTYTKYGKVWREVMFYTHAVSLPFCLLMGREILAHAQAWMDPATHVAIAVPSALVAEGQVRLSLFVFLGINLLTQSVCFKGVAMLTCHTSALTISLALTLRKFVSLVLSIVYFSNPFTLTHWTGSALVFAGIIAYTNEAAWKRSTGTKVVPPAKEERDTSSKTKAIAVSPPAVIAAASLSASSSALDRTPPSSPAVRSRSARASTVQASAASLTISAQKQKRSSSRARARSPRS